MTPVIVPYVTLHPSTAQVLSTYGLPVTFQALERTNDDAYRQLLQTLWRRQETVIVVEQDIVPWPGALEELAGCIGLWCACAYKLFGGFGCYHGLGCAKLSAKLMALLPELWDEPCHWSLLDQRLWFQARAIGQDPHPHRPPVIHLGAHAEATPGVHGL